MVRVIPFMELMKEVSFILDIHLPNPEFFCKVFDENKICIFVAESTICSPGTKHIAIKYHRFRRLAQNKIIRICYIYTREKQRTFSLSHLKKHLQWKVSGWRFKK